LSDAKKRELYDRGGEKAIKEGGIASEMRSPMDIFDMFFNMGHARSHRGPPRGRDVAHQMAVTLEDLYSGAVRKLALQKNIICPQCKGLFRLYVELHVCNVHHRLAFVHVNSNSCIYGGICPGLDPE